MNTKIVTLTHGIAVGDAIYKNLRLREPVLDDYCTAEEKAHPQFAPIKFRRELAAVCLEKADEFTGPFTGKMFGKLKQSDWNKITKALQELEGEGEGELPSEQES